MVEAARPSPDGVRLHYLAYHIQAEGENLSIIPPLTRSASVSNPLVGRVDDFEIKIFDGPRWGVLNRLVEAAHKMVELKADPAAAIEAGRPHIELLHHPEDAVKITLGFAEAVDAYGSDPSPLINSALGIATRYASLSEEEPFFTPVAAELYAKIGESQARMHRDPQAFLLADTYLGKGVQEVGDSAMGQVCFMDTVKAVVQAETRAGYTDAARKSLDSIPVDWDAVKDMLQHELFPEIQAAEYIKYQD